MKRFLTIALMVIAVLAGIAYLNRTTIVTRLIDRIAAQRLATDLVKELPDGLHVALCGAGSPLPDPKRSGPCSAVIAGDRVFVVDSGSGSSRVMAAMQLPQGAIEAIFLTHFHSDHIDGLGELLLQRWVTGTHRTPVPMVGPEGVENISAGLKLAYAQDVNYRVAHHGEETVPRSGAGSVARPFATPAMGQGAVVFDDGGVKVTAFRVEHDPVRPAVGYRFDYKGRSVAFSGDTIKSANLEKFAKGVDLLVHEALDAKLVGQMTAATERAGRDNLTKITRDILDYHATPVQAAESAQTAGVGHLLYYHVVPPLLLAPMEDIFLEGVGDAYDGPVTLGRDGTLVVMEANGEEIEVRELL